MAGLAGHEQANLPHALRALPGRGPLDVRLLLPGAVVVLLVKLLLAALPLLLEPLDDVNGTADVGSPGDGRRSGFVLLEVCKHAGSPGQ